jgi:deoxynucleoside triphosphate triphosphohydrolase SAMHD1
MLGLTPDLSDDDEKVSNPLPDGAAQWLRSADITFLFACGTDKGQSSLKELLRKEGVAPRVEMMHTARRLDDVPLDVEGRKRLRKFLRDVGFSLNMTNQSAIANPSKWNDDLCKEWALGYGGMELITASFYGVPTATITAIWKQGNYDGKPWMPLLPRSA